MAAVSICLHNKFGFCKHGEKCWKEHTNEICNNNKCNINECNRRHPKECRYFRLYKRCKFGEYCAFDHTDPKDPVLEEIKHVRNNVKALEEEMKNRNNELNNALKNVEKALNALIHPQILTSPSNTAVSSNESTMKSTFAIVTTNTSSTTTSRHHDIPQLDGQIDQSHDVSVSIPSITRQSQNRCENCEKNFETEKDLKIHMDKHEWGCDDCFLCFTTKVSADLHELQHHGDSPDSIAYIRDHIPESTKRLFAIGHTEI